MSRGAVGIHLGNTESCVAIYANKKLEIIENELGERFTQSVITFTEESLLTGPESVIQLQSNPPTTICVPEIRELIATLSRMKRIAEARLQNDVTAAVVTVPAFFTKAQKDATTEAANMAGLKIVKIIEEPIAAALAFDNNESKRYRSNIIFYDFGRQSCNVSIVTIEKEKCMTRLTKTDRNLGGKNIGENVKIVIKDDFKRAFGNDFQEDPHGVLTSQIKDQSNSAIKAFSCTLLCKIEFLSKWKQRICNILLPKPRFEEINEKTFNKTMQIVDATLQESGLGDSFGRGIIENP